MESNVTLIRNLIKENKTYKHISEILRQNFPEVTRGFSERNVRLFCAKYGIRRLNEYEVDSIVQDCVNEVSLFLFLYVFVFFLYFSYQTLGCIFELTLTKIFAPFMAIFIVFRKAPLLSAKQKLRLRTRSKIINREIQRLRKPP